MNNKQLISIVLDCVVTGMKKTNTAPDLITECLRLTVMKMMDDGQVGLFVELLKEGLDECQAYQDYLKEDKK